MSYRIESKLPLYSNWLPADAFTQSYDGQSTAIASTHAHMSLNF
jgi:hypothetical protein